MAVNIMNIISYTSARASFKQMMDDVCIDHEPTVITRQSGDPVVLLSLSDYKSLEETLYLLSSPSNAEHLKQSIAEFESGAIINEVPKNVQKTIEQKD